MYDLVVIGGGSAGLVCTLGAAAMGARVALIEKDRLGGDCLHHGCIPSKALIRAARAAHEARTAARFGVEVDGVRVDFAKVMQRVREVVETVGVHDQPAGFRDAGAEVIFGAPRFLSPHRIQVDGKVLEFKRAVLATGSHARVPDVPGLREAGYLTNATVFGLQRLPPRLLVLGGGPVGCEMAQAFARLGSRVTLSGSNARLLPRDDPDASQAIAEVLRDEGVDVRVSTQLREVATATDDSKRCTLDGHAIEVDDILVATGRAANTEGLALEAAGIALDERGYVQVDAALRTTARNVWACGDVHGGFQFTHAAEYEAKMVLAQALFRVPMKPSYRVMPWTTFTDPEVAHVGLTEAQARDKGLRFDAWRFDAAEVDRAMTERATRGFFKILADPRGRILGVTIVAAGAGDIIGEAVVAMQKGMKARDLSEAIHVYPTMSLGLRRAADRWTVRHFAPPWLVWLARKLFGYRTDVGRSALLD